MEQQMTKAEMIEQLAQALVEVMDINDLIAYATEKTIEDLSKQSRADIQDQYQYIVG